MLSVTNMKYLFQNNIHNLSSWGQVFQSIEAWEPLINFILKKEKLPVSKIENLEPGSNAVFKSGSHVVKIFAPKESEPGGFDRRAAGKGLRPDAGHGSAPRAALFASGLRYNVD